MADYDLGTARGRVTVDSSGAVYGFGQASAAQKGLQGQSAATAATLGKTGVVMAGAGVAIAAGLGLAIKAAAEFDKQLSAVKSVSGATEKEMELVRAKALQLGRDTAFGAGEAAQAMFELSKAGLSTTDIIDGAADATVALAAAGEIDLAEAASIAAASMNQFNLEAEESIKVADLLSGAANSSATDVRSLGESLKYAGPFAAAAGVSIEDTVTAMAALADQGITGSMAGTAFRQMLIRLQPASADAAAEMKNLGLLTEDGGSKFFTAEGKMKSMSEVSGLLQGAISGLSDEQRASALETIFGARAMSSAIALAAKGTEGFDELAQSIGDTSAQEVAAEKLDNLSGSMTILQGSIETMLIEAGSPLQDGLKGIVDVLIKVVNWIANVSPEVQRLIGIVAAGSAAFLVLVGTFLVAYNATVKLKAAMTALRLALLANPIVLIIAGLVAFGAALVVAYNKSETFRKIVDGAFAALKGFVLPIIDSIRDGIGPMINAFKAADDFGFDSSDGILGFMVMAGAFAREMYDTVEPVVVAIIDWFKNFAKQMGNLIDVFKSGDDVAQGFGEIMDNIFGNSGKYVDFFRSLYEAVEDVFGWIKKNVPPIVEKVVDAVGGWGNVLKIAGVFVAAIVAPLATLVAGLIFAYTKFELVRKVVAAVGAAIGYFVGTVLPGIITKVGQVFSYFQSIWPQIQEAVTHAFNVIVGVVTRVMDVILSVIRQVVNVIAALWRAWGDDLLNIVGFVWDAIKEVIDSAIKIVQGVIETVLAIINGDWGKAWDGIKKILAGAWDAMFTIVRNAFNIVKSLFGGFISTLLQIWNGVWDKLKGILSAAWGAIKRNTIDAIANVVGSFIGIIGRILGAIGDLQGRIHSFFLTAFGKMFTAAVDKVGSLLSYVKGIPSKILNFLGDVGSLLYGAGRKIIGGLIDGIKSKIGDVGGAMGGIAKKIGGFIPGSPVQEGPLKVLNRGSAGKKVVEMIIDGISDAAPALQRMMNMSLSGAADVPSVQFAGAQASGGDSFTFSFPNVNNGSDARSIREALSESSTLSEISRAVKAGRR